MAAAPDTSSERAVAALQLLQALHGGMHRALGAAWATEIPLLLQYLEGKVRVGREGLEGREGEQGNAASQRDGGELSPVPPHLLCCLSPSRQPALRLGAAVPWHRFGPGDGRGCWCPLEGQGLVASPCPALDDVWGRDRAGAAGGVAGSCSQAVGISCGQRILPQLESVALTNGSEIPLCLGPHKGFDGGACRPFLA